MGHGSVQVYLGNHIFCKAPCTKAKTGMRGHISRSEPGSFEVERPLFEF